MLERGFAATSVDAVIAEAAASKGGFFHYFRSKSELGLALLERYAAADKRLLEEFMAEAGAETQDPAEHLVAFVRRCLFVSFIYPHLAQPLAARSRRAGSASRWRCTRVTITPRLMQCAMSGHSKSRP